MDTSLSSLVVDVSPGLTLAIAGVAAASAAYSVMRKSSKGRARSAIAYLSGLAVGLLATATLAAVTAPLADAASLLSPGLLGSFFAPFAGLVRAKWEGPVRKRPPGWLRSAAR
jgi:hypothetical protein